MIAVAVWIFIDLTIPTCLISTQKSNSANKSPGIPSRSLPIKNNDF